MQADWNPRSGYEAGRVLALDPSVTAVLCGNDDLALGVTRAMLEAGRTIPAQVSVVGFDDTPQSAFFTPALTTVRLDFTELGRAAFALLQEQMGRGTAAWPRPEPGSCGRARGHRPAGASEVTTMHLTDLHRSRAPRRAPAEGGKLADLHLSGQLPAQ
jgi:hypothetical protein